MNPNRPPQPNPQQPGLISPTGAIIALSVLAATAFAVYESPEVRQFADNLRQRIQNQARLLGQSIERHAEESRRRREGRGESGWETAMRGLDDEPMFNRPEDLDADVLDGEGEKDGGVEADEASKLRQQEELEYWNAIRASQQTAKAEQEQDRSSLQERTGSSFDDFLTHDGNGEYVYRASGAEVLPTDGLTQRRGAPQTGSTNPYRTTNTTQRGIHSGALYANPFADEHGISHDEDTAADEAILAPQADEVLSVKAPDEDLYGTSTIGDPGYSRAGRPSFGALGDLMEMADTNITPLAEKTETEVEGHYALGLSSDARLAKLVTDNTYSEGGSVEPRVASEAFEAIRRWNESTTTLSHLSESVADEFFSPLPQTPVVLSVAGDVDGGHEADVESSHGMATPKTSASMSIIGEEETRQAQEGDVASDASSEDDAGIMTPSSWTEVGSVRESGAEETESEESDDGAYRTMMS